MKQSGFAKEITAALVIICALFYNAVAVGADGCCGGGSGGGNISVVTPKEIQDERLKELQDEKFALELTIKSTSYTQETFAGFKNAVNSLGGLSTAQYYEDKKKYEAAQAKLPQITAEIASLKTQTSAGGGPTSCPYLYTWDGNTYVRDNDIIPFKYPELESLDYYRIQKPLKAENGYYKLRIAEELPEVSYIDFARFMTIDYPANLDVYPDLKGNIFNISDPRSPVSCVDNNGNDCLSMLKDREEVYAAGTYFEGNAGDYVTVDFGNLSGAKTIKLVMTTDGLPDLATSPLINPGTPSGGGTPGAGGCSIMVITAQQGQNGIDTSTPKIIFTPHELWATNVFDITGMFPDANGENKLTLYFSKNHKIDYIGIDTTIEIAKEIHLLSPVFTDSKSDAISKITTIDNTYAVMTKGDELVLLFPEQAQNTRKDTRRAFVFVSKGYYIPTEK